VYYTAEKIKTSEFSSDKKQRGILKIAAQMEGNTVQQWIHEKYIHFDWDLVS